MGKTIGIDLGTTNSVVAVEENGQVRILENNAGNRTTPSVVSFKDGEIIIGDAAKRQAITNPNTIISVKRFMGTDKVFKIEGKEYKPEQISAMILEYLKKSAEDKLNEEVQDAIITVPAYFDDRQRQATKDAGKIAGLNVLRIINEPTAAALAYGIDSKAEDEIILVYDLGGGTFDVSVLQLKDGIFEVLSTSGNNKLGGDDFDQRIIDWVADEFKKVNNIDLNSDKMAMQRLKEEAERAKKNLSSVTETTISLPFIINTDKNPLHIEQVITKEKFEELVKELVELTVNPVQQALEDAGLKAEDIDELILVGGSTRIPLVRKLIIDTFKKEPNITVNPDEVVAIGAAYQGSLISGNITDIVLLDVTPLTLGIETQGGIMTPLILRNATIPVSKTLTFTTVEDNQSVAEFKIFQGERLLTKDNKFLGDLVINNLNKGPAGSVKMDTTFSIDEDGIIKIVVRDNKSNQVKEMLLEDSTALADDELTKLIAEAKVARKNDELLKKAIQLANIGQRKNGTIKKHIQEAMKKGFTNEDLFKFIDFSREYDFMIAAKDSDKLLKANKQANKILEEIIVVIENPEKFKSEANSTKSQPETKTESKEQPVEAKAKEEPTKSTSESKAKEEDKTEEAKTLPTEAFILEPVEEDESDEKVDEAKAKQEADKVLAEAKAKEEADKKAAEEKAKKEADKKAAEEKAKKEAEDAKINAAREAAEKAAKQEKEALQAREAANKKQIEDKKAAEAKAKKDSEAKQEADKKASETKAKEDANKKPSTSNNNNKQDDKKTSNKKNPNSRVKNEELDTLRKELDSLRLKNLELFDEMEDIKKEENK